MPESDSAIVAGIPLQLMDVEASGSCMLDSERPAEHESTCATSSQEHPRHETTNRADHAMSMALVVHHNDYSPATAQLITALLSDMTLSREELARRGVVAEMVDLLNSEFYGNRVMWSWTSNIQTSDDSLSVVVLSYESVASKLAWVHVLDVWSETTLYEARVEGGSVSNGTDYIDNTRLEPILYIQMDLLRILTSQTFIVGRGVCEALRALRIAHPLVIDVVDVDLPSGSTVDWTQADQSECARLLKRSILFKLQVSK